MKKYPKEAKIHCPHCDGKGYMLIKSEDLKQKSPYLGNRETKELRNRLRVLNEKGHLDGLSLRSIGKLIGINSAQQVKHHILMLSKLGWDKKE